MDTNFIEISAEIDESEKANFVESLTRKDKNVLNDLIVIEERKVESVCTFGGLETRKFKAEVQYVFVRF